MIGSRSWNALIRRNLIYRKRYYLSTFFELILPVCGIWILIAIKNVTISSLKDPSQTTSTMKKPIIPNDNSPQQVLTFGDYLTALQSKKVCVYNKTIKDFYVSGIIPWNWQVPLVKCDSRKCVNDGQDALPFCDFSAIGVTGQPDRIYSFLSFLEMRYPILAGSSQINGTTTGTSQRLSPSLPINYSVVHFFESNKAMDEHVQAADYLTKKTKIAIGISFDDSSDDPNVFSYSIRPNSTQRNAPEFIGRPGQPTTPDTEQVIKPFAKLNNDSCVPAQGGKIVGPMGTTCTGLYTHNGVLTIQRLVQDYILYDVQQTSTSTLYNNTNSTATKTYIGEAGVQFVPFPTRAYTTGGIFAGIKGYGPLLITLGLLFPIAAMTSYITQEKELRQKELMKMMSVAESDIGWSWFVSFFLLHCTVTSLLVAFVSDVLYDQSEFFLLWLFWFFTFIAVIVLCMTIAALFTKSLRGILVAVLVFFAGSILAVAIPMETGSRTWILMISIHPIASMTYGLEQIGMLEDQGVGLTFDTTGLSLGVESGYSFRTTMGSLFFNSLFWGFLTWYFNRVIAPDYGQALPFYFPFMPSYWFPPTSDSRPVNGALVAAQPSQEIPYEPVSETLRRQSIDGESIEIHNLRKVFGTVSQKVAVDGLNLSMYKGQITALLGHNGAGKTTTIGLLTGAIAPTDGYATITGQDIRTSMSSIRQNIGICLQHDCLFPMLTVREHVQFFARIKGLYHTSDGRDNVEESIDQSLRDVALFEKRNTYSKSLSGGMKRKLSVAIAFSGGSKVVVLDEPTSGMDPFSRRFTWNVIRQYRPGRCIILTTHFMDEADILGDRIAIMADGQLRCAGSSLFLKKTYGVGYQLTIEKGLHPKIIEVIEPVGQKQQDRQLLQLEDTESNPPTGDVEALVNDIVLKKVKDSSLLNNSGLEIRYQLPMESSSSFPKMFQDLDHEVDSGTIQSYGVSMTTLDEVFLLVARGERLLADGTPLNNSIKQLKNGSSTKTDRTMRRAESLSERSKNTKMELENDGLFLRHITALTRKRAANFSRDKKAWCCTTLAPTFCVLLSLILVQLTAPNRNLKPITLKMSDLNPDVTQEPVNPVWYNTPDEPFTCQPGRCSYPLPIFQYNGTDGATETYGYCGYLSRKLDRGNPSWANNNSCSIMLSEEVMSMFDESQEMDNITSVTNSSRRLLKNSDVFEATQYGAVLFTHDDTSVIVGENSTNQSFSAAVTSNCQLNSLFVNYTNPADCVDRYGGIGYVLQYNYTALHIAPLLQAYTDQAIIRRIRDNPQFLINVTIAPLPITAFEMSLSAAQDLFLVFILAILGFPMVAGAFGAFIVAERESKAKHLQTVAGVSPEAYWISTIAWDTMNYQIPLWITIALFFIFNMTAFTTNDRSAFTGILLLLFAYGPASASYTYCLTFLFQSPSLCTLVTVVSNFLFGMGGPVALFIMELLTANPDGETDLSNVITILSWVLRFNPTFCLGKGLFYVLNITFFVYVEKDLDLNVFSPRILLWDLIFLVIHILVYMPLAIQIDKWSTNPSVMATWRNLADFIVCKRRSTPIDDNTVSDMDSDVVSEEKRVSSGDANSDLIVLDRMSKEYHNGKRAVDNLSLGIPRGQCFGLLGINGAGKTTTMAMLTAEFPPTSGDATLAGFSVSREPEKTRRRIGYCPQFDAHFVNMTGKEHIELYAAIKGVPLNAIKDAACDKLKEVGLSASDGNRLCSAYSGGMRRRLSLAIATVGSPQIVFLDECSTGVDPVARREIWELVSDIVSDESVPLEERASVILTTHSMEECEALCPRIGIMANGRLRCLGSAQHLKNKFGQGFQVEIKIALVKETDEDFLSIAKTLADSLGASTDALDSFFCTLAMVRSELNKLTTDTTLSKLVDSENPSGYSLWRDASSPQGATLESVAVFATSELRMQKLEKFLNETFAGLVLRERQDLKVRYEVGARGTRISKIFTQIEDKKDTLWVDDYSVSQTSLEQVFNMHAAEAEKLKQGQNDR